MRFSKLRQHLVSSTIIGGVVALGAGAAVAQDAKQGATSVQEVVVTGSRIPRVGLTSVSPVISVSSQEVKLEGAVDAADLLGELPMTVGALNNTPNPLSSNTGYTTANLRGLGSVRTLVLVDGHRLAPGDPTSTAVDLDTVPLQLVDRVEVSTGGASAVYGSDAIAGVVNFVLKKNFEGLQIDAQYGFDQHDNGNTAAQNAEFNEFGTKAPSGSVLDGRTETITITVGSNTADGKGNVTGYFTYKHQEPVSQGTRDFSDCLLTTAHTCSGSANSNYVGNATTAGAHGTNSFQVVGGAGSQHFVPWGSAGQTTNPGQYFNSSPYQYLSRDDTRYQGGFIGHYDFNEHAKVYTQFSYTDDQSNEFIAPGGSFIGTTFTVNCDNPFLSANQISGQSGGPGTAPTGLTCTNPTAQFPAGTAQMLLGRRDVEGGPREQFYDHLSFRDVIGIKGQIDDAWSYDLSGSYAQTNYSQTDLGYFSSANLANALQVQLVNGVPTCVSVINGTDPRCQPYNPFVQSNGKIQSSPYNGVTQAALNYVEVPAIITGETTEQVVNLNFVGKLGKYGIQSPWAKEGVGVSIGAEYRRDYLQLNPDAVLQANALDGGSGAVEPVSGAYDVKEAFGEVLIPIAQGQFLIHDLSVEAAYRRADYSSAGTVGSYKFGGEYAPTRDIRFRGSFDRAVRAPNVLELYSPSTVGPTDTLSTDPCAGASPTASLTQCQRSGVSAAQYGTIHDCPASQCSASGGGNVALKPETSDTTTLGLVFTPTFFHNFSLTVDYFNINVMGAIGAVGPDVVLNECLTTGNPVYCGLVHRSASGEVWGATSLSGGGYVAGALANLGYLRTSGYDFESNYKLRLEDLGLKGFGSLDFSFVGTYTAHYIVEQAPGLASYDCAGLFGSECNNPEWKHKLRVTWNSPWKFQLSGQWRYIGSMSNEGFTSGPLAVSGISDPTNSHYDGLERTIAAYNYFDLSGTWQVKDGLVLRAGVNNIFDKDPPWIAASLAGTGSPNSYSNYDLLGRTIFVGLTANW